MISPEDRLFERPQRHQRRYERPTCRYSRGAGIEMIKNKKLKGNEEETEGKEESATRGKSERERKEKGGKRCGS